MQLPQDLRQALDAVALSLPPQEISSAAQDLSRRYREGRAPGRAPFVRTAKDVAAYAAVRLPATFAAIDAALRHARDALPGWQPGSLLDVGAGPGTALWAAVDVFQGLRQATLLERDPEMAALGRMLAARSNSPVLPSAQWVQADLIGAWDAQPADLVTAAYVVGELPDGARDDLVARLWQKTLGLLVLVEPGTPAGFQRILRARDQLLRAGAQVAAPCPHGDACPMAGGDWCHFAQRVERSRVHRQAKGGDLSYEDEKFSFVGLSRIAAQPAAGRVIRHPQARGGHVHLEVCSPHGLEHTVVSRRDGPRYRIARSLSWGSPLPSPDDA